MFTDKIMVDFAAYISLPSSSEGDPDGPPPPEFFSTLPYRTSLLKAEITKRERYVFEELKASIAEDFQISPVLGGSTDRGHAVCWVLPEAPLQLVHQAMKLAEMSLVWDGLYMVSQRHMKFANSEFRYMRKSEYGGGIWTPMPPQFNLTRYQYSDYVHTYSSVNSNRISNLP